MIPQRFIFEYPERCLELMKVVEPHARSQNLIGSFSLMMAPSLFMIPFERMKASHPLGEDAREPEIYSEIKRVSKQRFLNAKFWNAEKRDGWRFSRITNDVENSFKWIDPDGKHPMALDAKNSISTRSVDNVVRVIRNALAHGNVIYLDKDGYESPKQLVRYLGFLSRYEDTPEAKENAETYRLVTTTEDEFLSFLKAWAQWLQNSGHDHRILQAA